MNHHTYSDWIFEDANDLSDQQEREFRAHLDACENCRDLADSYRNLEIMFRRTEQVGPEPGFVFRWQARMEANRRRAHHRQISLTLGLVTGGLFLLLSTAVYVAWPLFRSPGLVLWTWIYQLFTVYTYADAVRHLVFSLLNQGGRNIPLIFWIFGLGMVSQLAVLWVVSYRLLTNPRRISI